MWLMTLNYSTKKSLNGLTAASILIHFAQSTLGLATAFLAAIGPKSAIDLPLVLKRASNAVERDFLERNDSIENLGHANSYLNIFSMPMRMHI